MIKHDMDYKEVKKGYHHIINKDLHIWINSQNPKSVVYTYMKWGNRKHP